MVQFTVPKAERKPDPAYAMASSLGKGEVKRSASAANDFATLAGALQNAYLTTKGNISTETSNTSSTKSSVAQRWKSAADKGLAVSAARRARLGQKKRSLQRTPLHMIVQRLKQLIERREMLAPSGRSGNRALQSVNSSRGMGMSSGSSPRTLMSPRGVQNVLNRSSSIRASRRDLNRTTSSKGSGMDMETIVDEICVTLQFIAEFMDKLPEETCMELARHVRMESANKDQVLARTGDEAHKFSLIVTGNVEKAPSLRQEGRFNPAQAQTLKKGDHFGSDCILKKERHSFAYCAMNSVTMLVIDRDPFKTSFGRYIKKKQGETADFLSKNVEALKACDLSVSQFLAEVSEEVTLPPATEFDMLVHNDVYFVLKGQVNLMVPKVGDQSTKIERGKNRSSKARDEAVFKVLQLDNETDEHGKYLHINPDDMPIDINIGDELVTVFQGQAFSTFGTDFKRGMAETQETMKVIAQLQLGTYLGGGTYINGEDPLLSEVKAFVPVETVCLKLPYSVLMDDISDDVKQLLRNEAAFQLTYYLGRQGLLGKGQVVGHESASIFDKEMREMLQEQREMTNQEQARRYMSGRNKKTLSAFQQSKKAVKEAKALYMKKANEKLAKKVNEKDRFKNKVHVKSEYPVGFIMKCKSDLEEEHVEAMEKSIVSSSGTPVERYWGSSGSKGAHQTKMLPLLTTVFGAGLRPLSDKVQLMEEYEERVELRNMAQMNTAWGEGSSPRGSRSPVSRGDAHDAASIGSLAVSPGRSPPPGGSLFAQYKQDMAMRRPSTSPAMPSSVRSPGSVGSQSVRFEDHVTKKKDRASKSILENGVASVRAAGVLWDQMQGHKRPYVRQCLTFAEIAKVRNAERRETSDVIQSRAKHDDELRKLKDWSMANLLVGTTSGAERHLRPRTQQVVASGDDVEDEHY